MPWRLSAPEIPDAELADGVYAVGRGAECDVLTPETDLSVSRRHALLTAEGLRLDVEDAGSRNGTRVNGRRRRGRVRLWSGDIVCCGETALRVDWFGDARTGDAVSNESGEAAAARPSRATRLG